MSEHEVDFFRCDALSGDDEVAFVFAVFVVNDDDEISFFEFDYCFLDSIHNSLIIS